MPIVNEVITKFSFLGSVKKLDSYNDNLSKSIFRIGAFSVASIAAVSAMTLWSKSISEAVDPTIQFSRNTDVSIEKVQELGYVASQNASSLDQMQSSLEALTKKIGSAAKSGSADFSRLGISVRDFHGNIKTADVVFQELRGKLSGYTKSQQIDFASSFGLDKSLIQTLNLTSNEMDELIKDANRFKLVTKDQGDILASTNDSYIRLSYGISSVSQQLSVALAPSIERVNDMMVDLLADNQDMIINGFNVFLDTLSATKDALIRVTPFIVAIGGAFVVSKIAALGFAGAMGVIFSPVILITAAIVAAIVVVDDLIVAFRGGDSVIANFVDGILEIEGATKKVLEFIVGDFMNGFNLLKNFLVDFSEWFISDFAKGFNDFMGMFDEIISFFSSDKDVNINVNQNLDEQINNSGEREINSQIANYPNYYNSSLSNQSTSNNTQQTVSINIESTDPIQAGIEVRDSLSAQLRNANDQIYAGS